MLLNRYKFTTFAIKQNKHFYQIIETARANESTLHKNTFIIAGGKLTPELITKTNEYNQNAKTKIRGIIIYTNPEWWSKNVDQIKD